MKRKALAVLFLASAGMLSALDVAGLTVPATIQAGGGPYPGACCEALHFLMDVEAEKIIEAWTEGFENSAGFSYDVLKDKMTRFNGCFREDSKRGTRYDIVYVPGEGLAVSVNGSEKTRIPGLDFKKAVFGICLGERPADKDLKKGMLK